MLRPTLATFTVTVLATTAVTGPSPAVASSRTNDVSYGGVTVSVPADWPVVRLAGSPGCVRFDRHAVYLGDPTRSTCPASSDVAGRAQSVHLTTGSTVGRATTSRAGRQPGSLIAGGSATSPDLVVTRAGSPLTVVLAQGRGGADLAAVADSAVWSASSSLPAPVIRTAASAARAAPGPEEDRPRFTDTTYTGLGFDACTAPSLETMAAWYAASPYKAANIYIGGASRGCAQPNLTAAWVSAVIAQGWVLIPTYVGLQAPCTSYPHRIDPFAAAAQGIASADDAIAQLAVLGLGIGNPVYFDMEHYSRSAAGCEQAVIAFVDAWTAQLHVRGYVSGVYGSGSSMMTTLVAQQANPSFRAPDMVWIAHWNGDPSTASSYVPAELWSNHQRIHQYRGGHVETWGGVAINIDNDAVDAAVAPSILAAEGSFVMATGRPELWRITGGAPLHVSSWEALGLAPQPVAVLSQTQFDALPTTPADGAFLQSASTGRIWRVVGGVATYVPSWEPFGGPLPATGVDQQALDLAGTAAPWDRLRSGPPTLRTTGPRQLATVDNGARFSWVKGYSSSAVVSYDVRWRKASWDGPFGPWTRPAGWQATGASDVPLGLRTGNTYCVSVRARNVAGGLSGWTDGRCLTRALDDRRLTPSGEWTNRRSERFFRGSALSTSSWGATVTRTDARVRRVGVVATECPSCGRIAVFVNRTKVGRIDLSAPVRHRRQVHLLPPFPRRGGTITVRVTSVGEKVQVDGLVVSRT